jgi:hypothetical protein
MSDSRTDHPPARLLTVGLIASRGPAAELAEALLPGLTDRISAHFPDAGDRATPSVAG